MEEGPRNLDFFFLKYLFGDGEHGVVASSWTFILTLVSRASLFPCEGEGETSILVDEGTNFRGSRLSMSD